MKRTLVKTSYFWGQPIIVICKRIQLLALIIIIALVECRCTFRATQRDRKPRVTTTPRVNTRHFNRKQYVRVLLRLRWFCEHSVLRNCFQFMPKIYNNHNKKIAIIIHSCFRRFSHKVHSSGTLCSKTWAHKRLY